LPGVRADALFSRADKVLAEANPDHARVEQLLKEGLSLRTNDFQGWMTLGNILLLRGERAQAIAAYQKARDSVPPTPVRQMFEDQIRLMSTQPLESVTPMRNPSTE
jgi:cytochrome c-type biogenesis protein CcmH/NrfG